MAKKESRRCIVRLVVCVCAVASAVAIEQYVQPERRAVDAAAVFAAVGKIAAGEGMQATDLGGEQAVLSIPELPQTTAEVPATVIIAYAAE